MEKIYIAEDEKNIRETVKAFLKSEGYDVHAFKNGDLLYEAFVREPCDLVILDVMMPGSSGFVITDKIRQKSTVPIIILTAKDSDLDYATGINLGSDDYFTKPFSAIALVMRVKAILRRVKLDKNENTETSELNIADLNVNLRNMIVRAGGETVEFTPFEYKLLVYLIKNKDRAVSRDELLDNIWGYGKEIETRACDDTIRRIRKKISDSEAVIETIWGFGFIIKEKTDDRDK